MGGFLQSILFGYGGLRLHVEELNLKGNATLLPGSKYLYMHQIKYLGASLSFNHTCQSISVFVGYIGKEHKLELVTSKQTYDLKGKIVSF